MADFKGLFVWYELLTTDVAAACTFYGKVVGWTSEKSQMPGIDYWMFKAGDVEVAGAMAQPEAAKAMGAPPAWLGYVGVDDVDASAEVVRANGGQVYMGPMDIPNVGRFAVIADPHGAVIGLFKFSNPVDEPAHEGPGQIGWRELNAGDLDADFGFAGMCWAVEADLAITRFGIAEACNFPDMAMHLATRMAKAATERKAALRIDLV